LIPRSNAGAALLPYRNGPYSTVILHIKDFTCQTRESWSCARRVVGKAEHLIDKSNPRFVVTSYPVARMAAAPLYEQLYCARGDMENRIKEQQLGLFADRTSSAPCAPTNCGCGSRR
jgi:Transposase DDE domain group 1